MKLSVFQKAGRSKANTVRLVEFEWLCLSACRRGKACLSSEKRRTRRPYGKVR